eukprot:CAMPEP_0181357018 /NCGR_PEP_ID=MMETSP1106-20121128/4728_1 /TAXON_ID=81844 /ORGANISM="Mantoniella antarctica, Strain SL-175" /LENGTH=80 /DNA_ID=CAMNT_0023469835 /DNA_START=458 /DNA_END=700 /DNA_ORIENTATION=+
MAKNASKSSGKYSVGMVKRPRMDTALPPYPWEERVMSTRNAERIPGPHRNAGDRTEGATGATTIAMKQTPALVATTARTK